MLSQTTCVDSKEWSVFSQMVCVDQWSVLDQMVCVEPGGLWIKWSVLSHVVCF